MNNMKIKTHFPKRLLSLLLALVLSFSATALAAPDASAESSYIRYRSHVQNRGWESRACYEGEVSGTVGQALRDECVETYLMMGSGSITGQGHVENIGWMSPVTGTHIKVGTEGRGLKLECVRYRLNGDMGKKFVLTYRVHVENIGWTNWACDFASCGTVGRNLRIEAIQFQLLPRVQTKYYVHTNGVNLNVRSGPSSGSAVIGKLGNNSAVSLVEWQPNSWVRIVYNGQIGYVHSQYLRPY